jgi:GntR family transcriptional regulator
MGGYRDHVSGSDLAAPGGRDSDLRYMRVAADITARIDSGELAPGTRLRSERDLAAHYEVAYHTIRRAIEVLRERGLIVSIHGRGTFVREPPTPEP